MTVEWWQLLLALVAAVAGATWAVERASQKSADGLYERLKGNDFKHVEDRLTRVERRVTDRVVSEVKRVEERLERVETRMAKGFSEVKELIQAKEA